MEFKKTWTIDKQFDFCYGHRVWSQILDSEFSLDNCCKCRHLHGHQGKIKIGLESTELKSGMVTDFKHLNWAKQLIDNWFDHKMIMDLNDPLLKHEVVELFDYKNHSMEFLEFLYKPTEYDFSIVNLDLLKEYVELDVNGMSRPKKEYDAIIEKYEGLIFVDFIPTSENLCKFIYEISEQKMKKLGVNVSYVDYWETPKSHCRYIK